ncbi:hypothetical protein DCO58_03465 [Helicobacter saguini]|uniref:Uncharacterized protein n=1 Tax=Helicobacter saguini TaxID=1548018 RepID=A0A347VSB8_9HELI|nr:hypothetical protein [Helicobacter saguini]MWV62570.1 hypothetical protein [Helicobacter saguini]MWV66756.1 hypothetical protein [Helicobacter saguini]MWV69107.1 hypothetical protein [Helicobacter saguini]MWV71338.1 hypothetical protein [Helicobacter saguini]TLD91538.1 hypothetical protein LS64_011840 [Helicobacter saguini]
MNEVVLCDKCGGNGVIYNPNMQYGLQNPYLQNMANASYIPQVQQQMCCAQQTQYTHNSICHDTSQGFMQYVSYTQMTYVSIQYTHIGYNR